MSRSTLFVNKHGEKAQLKKVETTRRTVLSSGRSQHPFNSITQTSRPL